MRGRPRFSKLPMPCKGLPKRVAEVWSAPVHDRTELCVTSAIPDVLISCTFPFIE